MMRESNQTRSIHVFRLLFVLLTLTTGAAMAQPTETRILSADPGLGDRFGSSAAITGSYGVIGAQADDGGGGDAGALYVVDLATGMHLHKILAADAAGGAFLGCSVAAHAGLIIGGALRDDHAAEDAGSAYIFDALDGAQVHKLTASDAAEDDWFGKSVAISTSYALVGSYKADLSASNYDCGAAYLYDVATGAELYKLVASDTGRQDWYGHAVAVSETYAVVGAPTWDGLYSGCGAVYVYDVATGEELWQLTTVDQLGDARFGNALALEGDILAVGAYWQNTDGGSDAGAVYVFDLTTGEQIHQLTAANPEGAGDWLGASVAISGSFVLAGATQQGYYEELEGYACLFDLTTGQEVMMIEASDGALDDNFGVSAAFDGACALIGADMDNSGGYNGGSAYTYQPIDTTSDAPFPSTASGVMSMRNHPNPFNPSTEISFSLPVDATVTVGIYDLSGKLVRRLLDGVPATAGEVRTLWDGRDDRGGQAPSGTYLCRAQAGDRQAVRKMTLVE